MSREEAQKHLKQLSRKFGIPCPKLKWGEHNKRGYFFVGGLIRMGPKAWRSAEACLVHEFAHALTMHRHGPRVHHERPFQEALEQVVRAFYGAGNERTYPWDKEYKSVQNYARRVGLLVEPAAV
jgi:hypothetical protein